MLIRLPASLERRLTERFPHAGDRDRFVEEIVEKALDDELPGAEPSVEADRNQLVGGTLHLFSDGGSRGNPGEAAIAAILEDPDRGEVLEEKYECIGVETNNVAEYRALLLGLKMAARYQPSRLICHLDSELVVKQVNGEYKVKMETLKPFVDEIQQLAMGFADVVFRHIPREDNYRADALVNRALDERKPASFRSSPPPARTPSPPAGQRPLW